MPDELACLLVFALPPAVATTLPLGLVRVAVIDAALLAALFATCLSTLIEANETKCAET
jgi:hypothetical protein